MNTHLRELAERRHTLVAESARQRALGSQAGANIRAALGIADRGLIVLHHLKRRPLAVGLVVAALTLLIVKPKHAVRWLGYGLTGYTMYQRVRRLVASVLRSDSLHESAEAVARYDS
jgi:hypothetical protein